MNGSRAPVNTGLQATQAWLRTELLDYVRKDLVLSHIEAVFTAYPLLRPKREMFIYDDGRAQQLVCLSGLLPMSWRGASYNIPINIWIPFDYPNERPIIYVVPTAAMVVKANKELDPSGRWEGGYLKSWSTKTEAFNLRLLCDALAEAFSREPPLYRKAKEEVQPSPRPPAMAPPVPTSSHSGSQSGPDPPPPPPPRPPGYEDRRESGPAHAGGAVSSDPRARPPPPIPPHPAAPLQRMQSTSSWPESGPSPSPATYPYQSFARPPPASQPPSYAAHPVPYTPYTQPLPNQSSQVSPPFSPHLESSPAPYQAQQQQPPATYSPHPQPGPGNYAAQPHRWSTLPPGVNPPPPSTDHSSPAPVQGLYRHSSYHPSPPVAPPSVYPLLPQASMQPKPSPLRRSQLTPDWMDSDNEPTSQPMPNSPTAPPVPPTPQVLSLHTTLLAHVKHRLSQYLEAAASEIERLRTAQHELLEGPPRIQDEMARLAAVRDVCLGVVSRLDGVVRDAESRLGEVKARGEVGVDEIVCADSIVGNQLIDLVAEENAIEDTLYHLHRALNSGRIDLDRFIKTTRSLAEEQFMKRALVEKILHELPIGVWSP